MWVYFGHFSKLFKILSTIPNFGRTEIRTNKIMIFPKLAAAKIWRWVSKKVQCFLTVYYKFLLAAILGRDNKEKLGLHDFSILIIRY